MHEVETLLCRLIARCHILIRMKSGSIAEQGFAGVTLLRALRPDIGGWVTLSPRYWAGKPSDMDGGWAPYSAVLNCDPSWSSKLARCLTRQCKRICAKAETSQQRVSK